MSIRLFIDTNLDASVFVVVDKDTKIRDLRGECSIFISIHSSNYKSVFISVIFEPN